ncbi:MAG: adenosylhomocysteine nucleosidase [Actinomycetota bacterium]|nr:adenosylhomocysteine nucleosidase [Actinomycetota bacterium]
MNVGAANFGSGPLTVSGTAIGQQTVGGPGSSAPTSAAGPLHGTARRVDAVDVGVLTVLDVESQAVRSVLSAQHDYRIHRPLDDGPQVHEAVIDANGHPLRIAAAQTLDRGPRSAALAHQALVRTCAPRVVLLVGIAGGINDAVGIGDVVVADEVIYYDARRVDEQGTLRRGQSHTIAAPLGHRLNEFFVDSGNTLTWHGAQFRVRRGPIGSGDAVVTAEHASIRQWLRTFNEKVLAVETEAAGVVQAFHEARGQDIAPHGWIVVRGISDTADRHKGHSDHRLASEHAAAVMLRLLPHLRFAPPPG